MRYRPLLLSASLGRRDGDLHVLLGDGTASTRSTAVRREASSRLGEGGRCQGGDTASTVGVDTLLALLVVLILEAEGEVGDVLVVGDLDREGVVLASSP